MNVQGILKQKNSNVVMTLKPGATVAEAAKMLSEKRIGAVVVSDDGIAVSGILSERDIVRELGVRGPACMSDTIGKIMTKDPIGCGLQDSSDDVFAKMTTGRFRHLPVLDDGKMIGLISIGDVVAARLAEMAMENDALQGMIMGN